MNRRALLSTIAGGVVVGNAGCIGGGSDVVANVQTTVEVLPGSSWVKKIPDVSDPGGAIQYRAEAKQGFDVYFFVTEDNYIAYDTFTDGGDPSRKPTGDTDIGMTAKKAGKDQYQASTKASGAREPITDSGPYFFVIDHTDYRDGAKPGEEPTELSVHLDLTVSKKQFGF